MTMTTPFELRSVFNFRDLGGLPTHDGRRIRDGQVFRSDGIHRLDEAEVEQLVQLGIRTVVDLRTLGELASAPSLSRPGLDVVHLPVIAQTWAEARLAVDDDAIMFLRARYAEMLGEGATALAAAVELLASTTRRPLVFHCSAGKDRTGVLAALVLEVLGVPHANIAHDYAKTSIAMARMLAWIRTERPDLVDTMAAQPPAMLACPPEAMRGFLDDLSHRHGGAAQYLLDAGCPAAAIDAIRAELLEASS